MNILERLSEFAPISDQMLAVMRARIICFVALGNWGVPLRFGQWITERLPGSFAIRLAQVIRQP